MAARQRLTTVQEDLKSKNTKLREMTRELKDLRTHIKDTQEERG
jgi:septal ring factor EnvC (AmiA/AmiB activator)